MILSIVVSFLVCVFRSPFPGLRQYYSIKVHCTARGKFAKIYTTQNRPEFGILMA
jgi:hypothetical protein